MPEATFRRRLKQAAIDAVTPAGTPAMTGAATVRISRHAIDAKRLADAEAEIERLRVENDGLRQALAKLEAEAVGCWRGYSLFPKRQKPDRLARALYCLDT